MSGALLIVNPFATRVTERRIAEVARALGNPEVARTERPNHATELARAAAGATAIYVFSGDGGFNEVLNGADGETPLGFVPGGGTSVLPRALGLPRDPVEAARQIALGRRRRISLGRVNGRRFGFGAGVGLDAELVRRLDTLGRGADGRRAGDIAFARTAAGYLGERRGRLEPVLTLRGFGRAAFALVANCDPYTYAGRLPLRPMPQARFELGLDLVAPRRLRPSHLPRYLGYVVRGRGQERAADLHYAHDLDRLELDCDDPLPLQADGEDLGDVTAVTFEAERDAVCVLT